MNKLHAIGMGVDNRKIQYGVVNQKGEILYQSKVALFKAKSSADIICLLIDCINDCSNRYPSALLGAGLGFPGIVENNIIVGGGVNLPGFKNIELGNVLRLVTRLNVFVDNDANLMALAEKNYGDLKKISDAIFLNVGTGIGGAAMINSLVFQGFRNRGTEFGHIVVKHKGDACACGARGCLEVYASMDSMAKKYKLISKDQRANIDFSFLLNRYRSGDACAAEVIETHLDYMASGIVSLVNIFNPQRVILGGCVTTAGNYYIREIERRVIAVAVPQSNDSAIIQFASLGNNAGILGGAARVFTKFQHPNSC